MKGGGGWGWGEEEEREGWEREVGRGVSGAPKKYSLRLWSDYK